jgi:hypothetical protein
VYAHIVFLVHEVVALATTAGGLGGTAKASSVWASLTPEGKLFQVLYGVAGGIQIAYFFVYGFETTFVRWCWFIGASWRLFRALQAWQRWVSENKQPERTTVRRPFWQTFEFCLLLAFNPAAPHLEYARSKDSADLRGSEARSRLYQDRKQAVFTAVPWAVCGVPVAWMVWGRFWAMTVGTRDFSAFEVAHGAVVLLVLLIEFFDLAVLIAAPCAGDRTEYPNDELINPEDKYVLPVFSLLVWFCNLGGILSTWWLTPVITWWPGGEWSFLAAICTLFPVFNTSMAVRKLWSEVDKDQETANPRLAKVWRWAYVRAFVCTALNYESRVLFCISEEFNESVRFSRGEEEWASTVVIGGHGLLWSGFGMLILAQRSEMPISTTFRVFFCVLAQPVNHPRFRRI